MAIILHLYLAIGDIKGLQTTLPDYAFENERKCNFVGTCTTGRMTCGLWTSIWMTSQKGTAALTASCCGRPIQTWASTTETNLT